MIRKMNTMDLTKKQCYSVPCPTCDAAAGSRCKLYAGGLRSMPHADRRLSAAETVERKRRTGKQEKYAHGESNSLSAEENSPGTSAYEENYGENDVTRA